MGFAKGGWEGVGNLKKIVTLTNARCLISCHHWFFEFQVFSTVLSEYLYSLVYKHVYPHMYIYLLHTYLIYVCLFQFMSLVVQVHAAH